MKIAFLCLAHDNFEYLEHLANFCSSDGDYFFIHVDKNVGHNFIMDNKRVVSIDNSERIRTRWGTFEIVDATLLLLNKAKMTCDFDRYILISGHDLPLLNKKDMKSKINSKTEYVSYWLVGGHDAHGKEHHDFSRFHFYYTKLTNIGEIQSGQSKMKLYLAILLNKILSIIPIKRTMYDLYAKGSQWWCISGELCEYILFESKKLSTRNEFKYMHAPDEIYFHTLIINSKFKKRVYVPWGKENLKQGVHYIDWGVKNEKGGMLKFQSDKISEACQLGCLFARKIDSRHLDAYINFIKGLEL